MRLRSNFVSGTLDNNPLSATDLILTSSTIDLPELVAGYDYYPLILDPGEVNGDLEVVYVTEHADGATPSDTAVIARGKEGTTQRIHPTGTLWAHAPTKLDGVHFRYEHAIDYPKHTADTPDDDFEGPALDAKWTLVDGTQTDITTLIDVPTQDKHEINQGLVVQTSNSTVQEFRQTYTLPVGNSIVAKWYPNTNTTNAGGPDSSAGLFKMTLTDNTTSQITTEHVSAYFYTASEDTYAGCYANAVWQSSLQWVNDDIWRPTLPFYARIARIDTLVYVVSYSFDGMSWINMATYTAGSAMTYLWLSMGNTETDTLTPVFLSSCDWIREYSNDLVCF